MLAWGKVDVPSDLRRTIAIKAISHLYLDMFEHVRSKNIKEIILHTRICLCLAPLPHRRHLLTLASCHLYLRYSPIFMRQDT